MSAMAVCKGLSTVTRSVAAILTDVCTANEAWAAAHDPDDILSSFECSTPPSVSVAGYMKQVERVAGGKYWFQCLILIDELSRLHGFPVSHANVHRLILTAYSIVLKVCLDGTGVSLRVAEDGGVTVSDLTSMEVAFLELLNWRVIVGATAYEMLKAKCRIVQGTACTAAAGPKSGPITLIPVAVVPREVRFDLTDLKAPVPVAPAKCNQQPFRRSHCSTDSMGSEAGKSTAGEPRLSLVPNPPQKSNSASSLRRLRCASRSAPSGMKLCSSPPTPRRSPFCGRTPTGSATRQASASPPPGPSPNRSASRTECNWLPEGPTLPQQGR
eukprot:TRINITY_DN2921_c0_g1_i2.p1 TRINITY_DN2921_c0_g1~~TRINITY_DN2921_c0_g1_i2.p1  ORF type:complete len:327 (+),score=37.70 TRINITY_DN2921_c0_g1_i2:45-1025(+)